MSLLFTEQTKKKMSFACGKCGKKFSTKRYLRKHELRGHKSKDDDSGQLSCSMCSKKFTYLSHLQRHQLSHLNVREFECPHCATRFVQKAHLDLHVSRKHSHLSASCLSTGHYTNDHLTSNFTTVPSRIPPGRSPESVACRVFCVHCGASFETRWHLARHQTSCHSKTACKKCGETVLSAEFARIHCTRNDPSRRHHCCSCPKTFARLCDLRIHEQTHSREGTLLCVLCNSVFIQRTQLNRHISKAHDSGRNCNACGENFSMVSMYCSHMKIIHGESVCPLCGDSDSSVSHREKFHWRRLKEPRPVAPLDEQQNLDPAVTLVIEVGSENIKEPLEVHTRLPDGFKETFPGLAHLTVRLSDLSQSQSVSQALVLRFPVDPQAAQDESIAKFLQKPVHISFCD